MKALSVHKRNIFQAEYQHEFHCVKRYSFRRYTRSAVIHRSIRTMIYKLRSAQARLKVYLVIKRIISASYSVRIARRDIFSLPPASWLNLNCPIIREYRRTFFGVCRV